MTYRKLLEWKSSIAINQGKEKEAIWFLVSEISGRDKATFYTTLDDEIGETKEKQIIDALNRYLEKNEPVQYILGYSYFCSRRFEVNKDVLIPRPETEELVAQVLLWYQQLFNDQPITAVDIGTGSGAIAITLALEKPQIKVYATDISKEALKVARHNALNLQADVIFLEGDMLDPLIKNNLQFDLLVSNPPYIPQNEIVESYVRDNEPNIALFGGKDGLKYYHQILANAHQILKPKNVILFEHHYQQKKEILSITKQYFPRACTYALQDIYGKDRFIVIVNEGKDD